jgi:uncharacterized ferredoxin-like protein
VNTLIGEDQSLEEACARVARIGGDHGLDLFQRGGMVALLEQTAGVVVVVGDRQSALQCKCKQCGSQPCSLQSAHVLNFTSIRNGRLL